MIRHIKWFIQRQTRGFDDRDLWSLDSTCSEWLLPRLKAFRAKGKSGVPVHALKDCGIDPYADHTDAEMERAAKHMDWVLGELIWFHECTDEVWFGSEPERYEEARVLWGRYYNSLWD